MPARSRIGAGNRPRWLDGLRLAAVRHHHRRNRAVWVDVLRDGQLLVHSERRRPSLPVRLQPRVRQSIHRRLAHGQLPRAGFRRRLDAAGIVHDHRHGRRSDTPAASAARDADDLAAVEHHDGCDDAVRSHLLRRCELRVHRQWRKPAVQRRLQPRLRRPVHGRIARRQLHGAGLARQLDAAGHLHRHRHGAGQRKRGGTGRGRQRNRRRHHRGRLERRERHRSVGKRECPAAGPPERAVPPAVPGAPRQEAPRAQLRRTSSSTFPRSSSCRVTARFASSRSRATGETCASVCVGTAALELHARTGAGPGT